VKWFRLAAEQGYAKAQFDLGSAYEFGEGVPKDNKVAFRWYRLAAFKGLADAQYALSKKYHDGSGVSQDSLMAYVWANLAVANGYDVAKASELFDGISTENYKIQAQTLTTQWLKDYPNLHRSTNKAQ